MDTRVAKKYAAAGGLISTKSKLQYEYLIGSWRARGFWEKSFPFPLFFLIHLSNFLSVQSEMFKNVSIFKRVLFLPAYHYP